MNNNLHVNKRFPLVVILKGKEIIMNRRCDCPFYSHKAGACEDKMYKNCDPHRCNRLHGKTKSKGYGVKPQRRMWSIKNNIVHPKDLNGERFYDWADKNLVAIK